MRTLLRGAARGAAVSLSLLNRGVRLPILYYHSLGEDAISVPAESFRNSMRTLVDNGYSTVSVGELGVHIKNGTSPAGRVLAISFDDCFESVYTLAFPVLQEHGLTATCFVTTDYVDGYDARWSHGQVVRRPYIHWEQLRELAGHGHEIGAHTRTHAVLPELSKEETRWEVNGSREILQDRLGVPVDAFAYPKGRFSRVSVEAVEESGFAAAVTTVGGTNTVGSNPFLLKRYGGGAQTQGRSLLDMVSGVRAAQDSINQSRIVRYVRGNAARRE